MYAASQQKRNRTRVQVLPYIEISDRPRGVIDTGSSSSKHKKEEFRSRAAERKERKRLPVHNEQQL